MLKQLVKRFFEIFFPARSNISVINKDEIKLTFDKSNASIISDIIISNEKGSAVYVSSIENTENIYYDKNTKLLIISGRNLNVKSAGSLKEDVSGHKLMIEVSVNGICLNIMKFDMISSISFSDEHFEVFADIISANVINIIGQAVN